ncbi:hypothetical protein [Komagataeibacter xylinus]|uniref:hypothetical protein n=1 Tax=Komagataeibacter xylinus TaxID=28448 RepID=UPI00280B17DE|nr:hypothetical protein [Komagataeibacter xylinus]
MSTHLLFHFDPLLAEQENRLLPRTNLQSLPFPVKMPKKYDIAATANPDTVGAAYPLCPNHHRRDHDGRRNSLPRLRIT